MHLINKLSKKLKNGIEILVDPVVFSYGSNSQNTVLVNNLRTAWPTLISMLFLSSLDNLLYLDACISFQKVDNFEIEHNPC